jgi:hypothetical protein
MTKISARLPVWLLLAASIASAGCASKYPTLAAEYAHAEEATATAILPYASLEYQSCRKNAAYRYFDDSLHGEVQTPMSGQPWLTWYAGAPFQRRADSVTWQAECEVEKQESANITRLLRALRSHGRAIAAIAEGKDFDASAIQSAGTAVGAAGTLLGQSAGFSQAASGATSAVAALTAALVKLYEDRRLEEAFATADNCMQGAFNVLDGFGEAVQGRLDSLTQLRDEDLLLLNVERAKAPFAQVAALADAYEFVGAGDLELDALKAEVSRDREAISGLRVAHTELAHLARSHGPEREVSAALKDLDSATDQLLENER